MRAAFAALLFLCGCVDGVFKCASSDQCVHEGLAGRCESQAVCSFPDPTCASGYRFGALAPSDIAETCVLVPAPADAPEGPRSIDLPAVADTTLAEDMKTQNSGADAELTIDDHDVAVVRFDVARAAGATVTAAELHVFTTAAGGLERGEVQVFRVLEDWDEASATWQDRRVGATWRDAGAGENGSRDRAAVGSATARASGSEVVIALPPSLVTGWISDGNFGIALVANDVNGNRKLVLVAREGPAGRTPFVRVALAPTP